MGQGESYIYLAVSILVVNLVAIIYTRKFTRLGFMLIVLSSVIWILARNIMEMMLGASAPVAIRNCPEITLTI